MSSLGAGIFLLCGAVCGVIMSDSPWIKVVSTIYLAYYAIAVIVEIVRGRWDASLVIVPVLLILLGMYVHGVNRMFDPRKRG
jgi:hypothetical protein